MVSLDKAVVARYEKYGLKFEILVDPYMAQDLKENKEVSLTEMLAIDEIFKDASKGERAAEENIKKVFGTLNLEEVVKTIIKKGEIQLTTEQRRDMIESKRKQIIEYIARNAINPQTKTPHPPARIEAAMKDAKVKVDPFKPVEEQVNDILDALRLILPIRFEKITIAVRVSGEDYGKIYGTLKNFGSIKKEEWQPDGMWIGLVEVPAGLQSEFLDKLNERTRGNVETRILK